MIINLALFELNFTQIYKGTMPASFLEVPHPAQHHENRRMSRFISRFVSGDSRSRIYGTMAGLGSAQQSRLASQFAFQCCHLP